MKIILLLLLNVYLCDFILSQAVYYDNNTGLYGVVDKNGNEIIKPNYKYLSQFRKGSSIFEENGKYGLMDETGKKIIKATFLDKCEIASADLYEGLVYLCLVIPDDISSNSDLLVRGDTKYKNIFYNLDGEEVINLSKLGYFGETGFCNGIAVIWDGEDKVNFINKRGQILSPIWYNHHTVLNDKHYGILINGDKNKIFYLINEGGAYVSDNQFVVQSQFDFKTKQNEDKIHNKECYNDLNNCGECVTKDVLNSKMKIEFQGENIYLKNNNNQVVSDLSKKIAYSSSSNEYRISFVNELFILTIISSKVNYTEKCYLINEKGDVIKEMNESVDDFLQYGCHDRGNF